METPKTLKQAFVYFDKPENCNAFMIAMRWPDGLVRCPTCDSENVTYLAKQRRWKCYSKHPKSQFSLKVGTIFEDSALGLDTWLTAIWLIANAKNGISSYELSRSLGITQKSAWHVLHRIRLAMQNGSINKLSGSVEVDETFIGGKDKNRHWDKKSDVTGGIGSGKVGVVGAISRKGNVTCQIIEDTSTATVSSFIRQMVSDKVDLIATDEGAGYQKLHQAFQIRPSITRQACTFAGRYTPTTSRISGCC